jgi:hypothetical protein
VPKPTKLPRALKHYLKKKLRSCSTKSFN